MQYRYVPVRSNTPCPYCQTTVPTGASVCNGCGAEHLFGYAPFLTPAVFLLLGIWLGGEAYAPWQAAIAILTAVVGSYATYQYRKGRPEWRR